MAINEPSTLAAKETEQLGEPRELDAITILIRDHRAVQQALNDYKRSKDPSEKHRLIEQVMQELEKHEQLEEKKLWPEVRQKLPHGEALAHEREAEEEQAKKIMAEIKAMSAEAPGWAAKVDELIAGVLDHAEHEELKVFTKIRSEFGVPHLMELGKEFEKEKKKER